ncbi:hypothetical protein PoB_000999600 [Plakobranchus ocellatus]|uniref:Uncharacterized protein n=1 Tax=Plakobranchus ocellatus TaxID=259542 RepID=A0AAV3YJR3_9GAST|nr:hypothetical protein PoB_000999600 [Plakobranchus ocellatus]
MSRGFRRNLNREKLRSFRFFCHKRLRSQGSHVMARQKPLCSYHPLKKRPPKPRTHQSISARLHHLKDSSLLEIRSKAARDKRNTCAKFSDSCPSSPMFSVHAKRNTGLSKVGSLENLSYSSNSKADSHHKLLQYVPTHPNLFQNHRETHIRCSKIRKPGHNDLPRISTAMPCTRHRQSICIRPEELNPSASHLICPDSTRLACIGDLFCVNILTRHKTGRFLCQNQPILQSKHQHKTIKLSAKHLFSNVAMQQATNSTSCERFSSNTHPHSLAICGGITSITKDRLPVPQGPSTTDGLGRVRRARKYQLLVSSKLNIFTTALIFSFLQVCCTKNAILNKVAEKSNVLVYSAFTMEKLIKHIRSVWLSRCFQCLRRSLRFARAEHDTEL